jgi:hypothetical protein
VKNKTTRYNPEVRERAEHDQGPRESLSLTKPNIGWPTYLTGDSRQQGCCRRAYREVFTACPFKVCRLSNVPISNRLYIA